MLILLPLFESKSQFPSSSPKASLGACSHGSAGPGRDAGAAAVPTAILTLAQHLAKGGFNVTLFNISSDVPGIHVRV